MQRLIPWAKHHDLRLGWSKFVSLFFANGLTFLLCFLLVVGFSLLLFFKPDEHAILLYQRLEQKSRQSKNKSPAIHHNEQIRKEVCKEVWIDTTSPIHVKIKAPITYLLVAHKEQSLSLVERLEFPVCLIQEKHSDPTEIPWQNVRRIEAKKATYDYNTGHLIASEVTLSEYKLTGHDFPQTLPNSPKSLIQGDFAEGIAQKTDRKASLFDTLTLTGNVSIQSFDEGTFSSALADRVEVDLNQNLLFLYGDPALFYDETQNLELAAKQIEALIDPETGKKCVKGHGKVRLNLTEAEFKKLEKKHICY